MFNAVAAASRNDGKIPCPLFGGSSTMKEATFPDSFRTWQKLRLEQSGLGLIVPPKSSFPGISLVEDIDVIAALIQALSGVDFQCPPKGSEAVDLAARLAIENLFPAGADPTAWMCTHSAYIETIHGLYWALIKRYEAMSLRPDPLLNPNL